MFRSIFLFFFQDAMFRKAWNTLRSLIRHECRPNCRWGIVCWSSSRRQLITAGHSMGGAQAELFSACANRHRPDHDMVRWAGKMLGHEGGHEDSRQMRNSCNSQLMFWVWNGQSGLAPVLLVTFCLVLQISSQRLGCFSKGLVEFPAILPYKFPTMP